MAVGWRSPLSNRILVAVVVIFALGAVSRLVQRGSSSTEEPIRQVPLSSSDDDFPGPWRHESDMSVARALRKGQILNCDEYRYKAAARVQGHFLVHCRGAGGGWLEYQVWIHPWKIVGPKEAAAS